MPTAWFAAWLWGRSDSDDWRVLDDNNATDADLWIAYSLLEASRLWRRPAYANEADAVLRLIKARVVQELPNLGPMLLPGHYGFESAGGWRLNPSYLVPQQLGRFAVRDPIWAEVERNVRKVLMATAPRGFAPDWVLWGRDGNWRTDPRHGDVGSYAAIRVYLWVGTLAPGAPGRRELLDHFEPMAASIQLRGYPPEHVATRNPGASGTGPVGFSAATLPLLATLLGDGKAVQKQIARLRTSPPASDAYYDQVLSLFGHGWIDKRYRFDSTGRLLPSWGAACDTSQP